MPKNNPPQSLSFETRYKALNNAQQQAVDTIEGPVMVIAGPGSGKTELLSLRIGNILRIGNARASNILCLTFTETAARNMRERLETLIGPDAYRVAIYTFHSFCTDVIGKYPEYFFNHVSFKPASDLTQSEILQTIFERLPHKHPLASFHPERGYAYLKECQVRIKDIKKGGLTPVRFKELLDENAVTYDKLHMILEKYLPERIGKDSKSAFLIMQEAFRKEGSSIAQSYASSIGRALLEVNEIEKTTPLSTWKSGYTGKDENGVRVFKDFLSLPKLYALASVYEKYQEALYQGGYFDYEDMILQVVEALTKHVTLRTELEEMYQYIMVDEFQDTNNAQLSLVKAISSNEVHEGRANVCVVGDDDQAIYKFQGAEISNIHSFKELYEDVEMIVLIENYRSTQKILDFARKVVVQGVNRLETRYKEIRKDLVAKNKKLSQGEIHTLSFRTQEEEYAYVGQEIKNLLTDGISAQEIAVIAREHKQLTTLLPYLDTNQIPYTYTRKENVFDEKHVQELIILCRFLATVGNNGNLRDELLPQILAFPFWGLSRITIWNIAELARSEHISWLAAMEKSNDDAVTTLAHFFIELGVLSQTTPLEIILDTLIGSKDMALVAESEYDDFLLPVTTLLEMSFVSPYKKYYFGENALKHAPSSYIHFLSSLRVFMKALREWKQGSLLKAADVGTFVDMHTSYNIPLINETPFAHHENSVELLTSHGAKGLEFAYVFVISVNDSIWAGGRKGNKIAFPENMPLASAGDEEDDFIRLLYVALTRARHTLYLTHHDSLLRFLDSNDFIMNTEELEGELNELVASGLSVYHAPPFAHDEEALLRKVVEGYMLSPTHVNNFLDITQGGPIKFLEQNILRFPQAKSAGSVYGSAIHKALEEAHVYAKQVKKVPELSMLIKTFTKELSYGRLLPHEYEKLENRGAAVLTNYYALRKETFTGDAVVECNFAHQGVVIDGAHITGKIDKMDPLHDKVLVVTDLKTGKGFSSFTEPRLTGYDEIKLHHYRFQLLMYKILVENSRDYENYTVEKGVLEFVEEEDEGIIQTTELTFEGENIKQEVSRAKKLISTIYKKIIALDFPETEQYPKTIEGIVAFEEDLLKGVV
jgi:DNA helicase-2/ATP-dependent DNA helicase PcrA